MLKVCAKDKIPLVNIVRRPEQEALLRSIEKDACIVNQSSPSFMEELVKAIQTTGATLCYDATGGGRLGGDVLTAFEKAGKLKEGTQLYTYGGLDTSPPQRTEEQKKKTKAWVLPQWQPTHMEQAAKNRTRVANEITTTFTSDYVAEVGLQQAVTLAALNVYGATQTGKKYLLNPQKTETAKL